MSSNILEAKNLSKTFTDQKPAVMAVNKVSFKIKKGSSLAIIGTSGSGKTTLLHMLGLLEKSSEGELNLDNHEVHKLSEKKLSRLRNEKIGFVFQDFNLLPELTVLENVMLPFLFTHKEFTNQKHLALEAIDNVGLSKRADFKSKLLSGGEKQRTAIARALIPSPQIILADEPTGNLDSKTGQQIIDLLFDLQKKSGITLIIVTHDLNLAAKADKIFEIKDGKLTTKK